jgi:hypothetical protein
MSKMGFHYPFGYLNHKLWPKERSGVKLPIWLSTTKSRELLRCICVHVMCHIWLESFRWRLQLFFKLHFNRRTPNLLVFDKSAWDMDIVTLCEWTIQFKTRFLWLLLGSSPKDTKLYLCNVTKLQTSPKGQIFIRSFLNYFIQWSLQNCLTLFGPFGWDWLY